MNCLEIFDILFKFLELTKICDYIASIYLTVRLELCIEDPRLLSHSIKRISRKEMPDTMKDYLLSSGLELGDSKLHPSTLQPVA